MFEEWENGTAIRESVERIRALPAWGRIALVAVLVGIVLAAGGWLRGVPADEMSVSPPEVEIADASAATTTPAGVVVHVVGAVRRPGVYTLPPGSRVGDAVEAAGGVLGNAATDAVNLARILNDGEQVRIPTRDEASSTAGAPSTVAGAPQKVNINSASATELDALPGIGPATAQKIVDDRTKNGPFSAPEDLMRVPGIGPKKFDALKDLITTG
ncbi:ComEA family DNA-binding protein [Coriobacteriia bacterium Es71-Z0120]|uniref:ComEA family DNA-binding protein n=1 Tax=Parvivirga hydrogeniphila TaxID=2939460 RepID=UPI002260EA1E|nr:ComEA family DNA-binding protein [Parvivirga hydrogeniphila]MCL4078982.1 ComEA family DNA-binding protein [Parvivirga hydrogeniphila]